MRGRWVEILGDAPAEGSLRGHRAARVYWTRRKKTKYAEVSFDLIDAGFRVSPDGLEAIRLLCLQHGYNGKALLGSTVTYLAKVPIDKTDEVFDGVRLIVIDPRYQIQEPGVAIFYSAAAFRSHSAADFRRRTEP